MYDLVTLVEHSKSVICFEVCTPVYEQLIKIKEKHNNVITHNLAVSDFVGKSIHFMLMIKDYLILVFKI